MPDKIRKARPVINRLKHKYRLVIMNDDTFEEQASFTLSPLNVFVFVGSVSLFMIVSIIYIIAFTSLREYIPGYTDVGMRKKILDLAFRTDSLQHELELKDAYMENIRNVISGNISAESGQKPQRDTARKYNQINARPSEDDLQFRKQIEEEEKNALSSNGKTTALRGGINSFFFFVPIKGIASNRFNASPGHYGVDIVAQRNEAIKATLDGTVVLSTWTHETGYVIQLQHEEDIISVYKHNSVLLKKVGERVKAGDPIAIIGESGEESTGPHLHFELWYKGNPVDPQEYMSFL